MLEPDLKVKRTVRIKNKKVPCVVLTVRASQHERCEAVTADEYSKVKNDVKLIDAAITAGTVTVLRSWQTGECDVRLDDGKLLTVDVADVE